MKSRNKRTRLAACGAVTLAVLLSACNPGPKYAKPPAATPSAFKEAVPQEYKEGEGWKIAQPGDDKIRGKWWEMYNDPQLNALEEQVQISNQNIAVAEANFRGARALIGSTRASLFPAITASASYTNSRFSQTARTTTVVPSAAGGVVAARRRAARPLRQGFPARVDLRARSTIFLYRLTSLILSICGTVCAIQLRRIRLLRRQARPISQPLC